MGAAVHRATRVFRMYNIDNRVEKVLSKDKPTPAPRYTVDQQQTSADQSESNDLQSSLRWRQSSLLDNMAPEAIHKKDEQLLDHLQDLKVYSTGDNPVIRRTVDAKERGGKLPALNRLEEPMDENSDDGAFGYVEPQRVPPGRVSLRQFLAYLQQHRDSPEEYSVHRFSDMYTIKPEVAERLFKYHTLLALQEVARTQSKATAKSPHAAAVEVAEIEVAAMRKPGRESGLISKY